MRASSSRIIAPAGDGRYRLLSFTEPVSGRPSLLSTTQTIPRRPCRPALLARDELVVGELRPDPRHAHVVDERLAQTFVGGELEEGGHAGERFVRLRRVGRYREDLGVVGLVARHDVHPADRLAAGRLDAVPDGQGGVVDAAGTGGPGQGEDAEAGPADEAEDGDHGGGLGHPQAGGSGTGGDLPLGLAGQQDGGDGGHPGGGGREQRRHEGDGGQGLGLWTP